MSQQKKFKKRVDSALADQAVRHNFRYAMDHVREQRSLQFSNAEELAELRQQAAKIKRYALDHLPDLLQQLEEQLTANGIQVHWAETALQANAITLKLLQDNNAKRVVKGKSMVTEETHLNSFLQKNDIEILESDLGEFIVQLASETPSHIIAPAIHKNRQQVAALFQQYFPDKAYTEDPEQLSAYAREVLRDKFIYADAGISGVNFAVAETGTLCLVENEGNGRLCTSTPDLHIAITGIEKVVASLSDLPPLLSILTRSATGQAITTYVNMISGPRQTGELDGPTQVHLILLDNGRSRIHKNDDYQEVLACIRCGACINHCPVYVQTGGHAYGTVYPGPLGSLLEPLRLGIDNAGILSSACTLCGACSEVCPVKIPLPKLINQLRAEGADKQFSSADIAGKGSQKTFTEASAWKLWGSAFSNPANYKKFSQRYNKYNTYIAGFGDWQRYRVAQPPAEKTLKTLALENGFAHE